MPRVASRRRSAPEIRPSFTGRTRSPPAPRCAMRKRWRFLVEEGPARVRELATAGAHFDLEPGGNFKLGKEAAHSRRRIVHAHGDQTGAEVARTLIKRVKESPRIEVLEKARILDLIVENGSDLRRARGASPASRWRSSPMRRYWRRVDCGQVYRYTTNPAGGDRRRIRDRAPRRREARRHGVRAVPPDRARYARESARS